MNLLPIEIYLILLVVLPLAVCFAKWKYSSLWTFATVVCAGLSWAYFNLWMMILDPPDNGFTAAVYFFTGWLWMLPIFAVILLPFRFCENRLSSEKKSQIGACGFSVCASIAIFVVAWNLFGRMSENRAITQARQELRQRGLEPRGKETPAFESGHWIVRYPECEFGEIRLTRNGKMSWIGGPG
jgi:hypothetical protein